MKRSSGFIIFLTIALLLSNGLWLYHAIDNAVTASYQDTTFKETSGALDQVLKIIPLACSENQENIIKTAKLQGDHSEPFYKEGYIWVSHIGLAFSPSGELIEVVKGWE